MCYREGELRAYLDGESNATEGDAIAAHLRGCDACRAVTARLLAEADAVATALEPPARLSDGDRRADPPRLSLLERVGRGRLAAAAAALLIAVSMSFEPVRGLATEVLKVFRIQQVRTVSFTEADIRAIGEALSGAQGDFDLASLGEVWVRGDEGMTSVSLAEAASAVDFPIVLPEGLEATPTIMLQGARTYGFKLKVDGVNELLRYYGSDRTFPREADGKSFEVKIPAVVTAEYRPSAETAFGAGGTSPEYRGSVTVGQARSPELVVPEGVDALELRDVLVNLPMLPEGIRQQLASVSDWQSTLLIPSVAGSARDTVIRGVPAVVIAPEGLEPSGPEGEPGPRMSSVIWNQDGVIRAVGGDIDEPTALRLAETMIR